jgi:hypothetical protein
MGDLNMKGLDSALQVQWNQQRSRKPTLFWTAVIAPFNEFGGILTRN